MTYEEAKLHKENLEAKNKMDSDKLKEFNKYGEGVMGMTPDHVRAMPEWKRAKAECEMSFAQLRQFNGWFVKTFKKEYAKDRRNRFTKKVN